MSPHHFTVHALHTNLSINTRVYAATYHSLELPAFQLFVSSADIKSSTKGTSRGDEWSCVRNNVSIFQTEVSKPFPRVVSNNAVTQPLFTEI